MNLKFESEAPFDGLALPATAEHKMRPLVHMLVLVHDLGIILHLRV